VKLYQLKKIIKKYYVSSIDGDKRPFHALLDLGIKTTTTGSRAFGAMKGAVDGGLDIPHSENRFAGYDKETKKYSPKDHRHKIFSQHVADYMRHLLEEDSSKYASQFSDYVKEGINADNLEEMYLNVHENIRKDPSPSQSSSDHEEFDKSFQKKQRLTLEERKEKIKIKKIKLLNLKSNVAMEEDDN